MGYHVRREFLETVCLRKEQVRVITVNGFQMTGSIIDYDSVSLVLNISGKEHLIMLSAISTMVPTGKAAVMGEDDVGQV